MAFPLQAFGFCDRVLSYCNDITAENKRHNGGNAFYQQLTLICTCYNDCYNGANAVDNFYCQT